MKITLVLAAAPNDPLRKNDPFMPLSLPLLAASAPDHDYTFVDMLAGEEPDLDAPVDLVGVSARLTAERTAYRIADAYRERGVTVVLGGPQISSVPHRAAEHADAVAVGEGEVLWPIIVRDAASGAGLERFYVASPREFDGGGLSVHHEREHLELERAPLPIEARSLYRKKYVFDTVYAARGCAVDCDFCSVPHLFGKKTRLRPADDVVREIETFKGFYYLLDDTVFGRPRTHAYYADLYDRIAALPGEPRLFTGQANLDAAATPEGRQVIRKAARAGFLYAMIGMESVNPAVLEKAGTIRKMGVKGAEDPVARMKEHIAFIQDQGIAISGWFTIGYEEDTPETFERNLAFCEETKIIPILCPLEALPGTRLHERLAAEGRVDENKKINTVHPTMSDDDILAAMRSTTRRGFSLGRIWERTRFYWKKFASDPDGDKVHPRVRFQKATFIWVLQHKLKKGVIGLANAG
jgi:radical SAM superfamily enzyme YgiQ (UPF0313 family)